MASYEQYIGRWSRRAAPAFLTWLGAPPARSWLDVGCGTGALCAAIVDHCSPGSVVGVEPSEGFLKLAEASLQSRVTVLQGSAASLPLADASVDVAVSGLVLIFIPDITAGMAEINRVTKQASDCRVRLGLCRWMEVIRIVWDAAVA